MFIKCPIEADFVMTCTHTSRKNLEPLSTVHMEESIKNQQSLGGLKAHTKGLVLSHLLPQDQDPGEIHTIYSYLTSGYLDTITITSLLYHISLKFLNLMLNTKDI